MFKDEQLMRNELKDVLNTGFTLHTLEEEAHFYFYLIAPNTKISDGDTRNIYGNMERTKYLTSREMAFAASYFLLGMLQGKGEINLERVTA